MTADQKVAVTKYDEVTQSLDLARDLFKQIQTIVTTTEKEQKKNARRVSTDCLVWKRERENISLFMFFLLNFCLFSYLGRHPSVTNGNGQGT